MAWMLCLTCGTLVWLLCWVCLGSGRFAEHAVRARLQSLLRVAKRGMRAFASSGLIAQLLALESFGAAADELSRHLRTRGLVGRLSREEAAALLVTFFSAACAIVGLLAGSLLAAIFAFVCGVVGVRMRRVARRRAQQRELASEMPGVLRTMATALESGNTLVQAIEYVGLHERGQAAKPFVRASLRLRCGMSVDEALESLREELSAPGVDLMVTALSISQRTGSPLRALLRRAAVLVEQQEEFERLLAVRTAQVRLSVRIVCSLPVIMVALLLIMSPDFQHGVTSAPGAACIVLAALMDGVALLLIRRIMGGVL